MSKAEPDFEKLLAAMVRNYVETKQNDPSNPKVTWTKDEMVQIIKLYYGEDWDARKIQNNTQTLKYRNLIEKVGQLPRKGSVAGLYLWCPIKVMEMETEPEVTEPEPIPTPGPSETVAVAPTVSLIRASTFEPVTYESQPYESLPEPDRMEISEQSVGAPETHDDSWGVTIPVQQGAKRKRKHSDASNEEKPDLLRTLHEMQRAMADIQRDLAAIKRQQDVNHAAIGNLDNLVSVLGKSFIDFDEHTNKAINNFLEQSWERTKGEVSAFKNGYVTGWNTLEERVKSGKTLNFENVRVEITRDQMVNTGVPSKPLEEAVIETVDVSDMFRAAGKAFDTSRELIDLMKQWDLAKSGFSDATTLEITNKMTDALMARLDERINEGETTKHSRTGINKIPNWAKPIWEETEEEFIRQVPGANRSDLRAFRKSVVWVEFVQVGDLTGKVTIRFKASHTEPGWSFHLMWVVHKDDANKIKVIAYPNQGLHAIHIHR